jgi:hypothetical protein
MRSSAISAAVVMAATSVIACSGDDAEEVIGSGGALPCAPGQSSLEDGRCLDAGMQADGCRAGEFLGDDGTCLPAGMQPDGCPAGTYADESGCRDAGVPPELCAEGFVPDGDHGCTPILPSQPCASGTMAIPGETECRELAPCGSGTYGSIPALAGTQYVNASYTGNDADGSIAKPWPSIQEGVDAAAPGALVAIAAGSYVEDIHLADKSVELWGRCPALVEVVATGAEQAAIRVAEGAHGTWIRSLAVTGPAVGIIVSGSVDVHVENVWLHDTLSMGVAASNQYGITQVTLDGVLVEGAQDLYGLYLAGVEALVVDSVVRDTKRATPLTGWGFAVQSNAGTRADVTMRRSLIERNVIAGGKVQGADLVIEGTVVRDNVAADGVGGSGLLAADTENERGNLVVRGCVIEHNEWTGISVLSSDATLEGVVIRDTAPSPFTGQGRGLRIEDDPERSKVDVRWSLFEANNEMGMVVVGSDVTMEGTRIVDTQIAPVEWHSGMGALLSENPATGAPATALFRSSYIGGSRTAAVMAIGTDATVHGLAVVDTHVSAFDSSVGDGIGIYADSHFIVQHSQIERSEGVGVTVQASGLEMDATAVLDTRATMDGGRFGMGVSVINDEETGVRASAIIRRSRVEHSQFNGIVVADADAAIESTLVRGVEPNLEVPGSATAAFIATFGGAPATAEFRGCILEEAGTIGLVVYGAEATVDATLVRESKLLPGFSEVRCVHVQQADVEGALGFCGRLIMNDSRVEGCDAVGISVASSEATLNNTVVRDARAIDGTAGDGLVAYAIDAPDACMAQVAVTNSYLGENARAALTNFGMNVSVGTTTFECNPIDIHGQNTTTDYQFLDLGGNHCGCAGEEHGCRVANATLEPPAPLQSP